MEHLGEWNVWKKSREYFEVEQSYLKWYIEILEIKIKIKQRNVKKNTVILRNAAHFLFSYTYTSEHGAKHIQI